MIFLRHDRRRRPPPTRGFTLVELITAASLMTLMMLGVVQIFAIITEAAGQAQGNAYAMEQGRALLDAIHRDIRGFDRSGYFKIRKSNTKEDGTPGTPVADPGVPTTWPKPGVPVMSGATYGITWYATDCLALTSVNYWEGQKGGTPLRQTTGAEVVYTANVKTPDTRFKVGSSTQTVDPRRGLVARGAWLVGGASATSDGSDTSDGSAAVVMADLASGKKDDRLKLPAGKDLVALAVSPIKVAPLSTAAGWATLTGDVWQVRRVATSCTSEFLIETLDTPDTGPGSATWSPRSVAGVMKEYTVTPIAFGMAGINKACPQAIRVTVAIHDPSDKKPSTGPSSRYEGFALQEVFWISDP
jgi:type II secretory pathway pseudopilin PulG